MFIRILGEDQSTYCRKLSGDFAEVERVLQAMYLSLYSAGCASTLTPLLLINGLRCRLLAAYAVGTCSQHLQSALAVSTVRSALCGHVGAELLALTLHG